MPVGNSGKRATGPGPIAGHATPIGTRRFVERFSKGLETNFFRDSSHGLMLSSLGMGTYLGECDDGEDDLYAEVIASGVSRGLNVLDTAINYRCQRSERASGRALRNVIESGVATRDELFVCTKGGYVPLDHTPPESREEYAAYLDAEYFSPGVMSRKDLVAGGHCLNPRFLSNQIQRSRVNLCIDRIDLYYLHNPEQQLDALDRPAFISVMRDAFVELESQVAAGRISAYGCATWNGFRVFAANRNHLSLSELVDLAEEAGGTTHHFRFVQLPVNLAMTEAVRAPTQSCKGRNYSLLELADNLGVSVIASASLMQGQLTRGLPPEVAEQFKGFETDAQRALGFVRSLPVTSALVGTRSQKHLDENIASGRSVEPPTKKRRE